MPYPHMSPNSPGSPLLNGSNVAVTQGQVVYLSSASTFKLAQAIGTTQATAIGIVLDASIAAGAIGNVVTYGPITLTTAQWDAIAGTTGGLAQGIGYYVSATTPGTMSSAIPTGEPIGLVGVGESSTVLFVAPQTAISVGTSISGVTADATSGKLVPATALEWDTLLGYLGISSGGPTSIYNFQDASGNILDANGVHQLGPLGIVSYQNAVPGWSRLSANCTTSAADTGFVKQHSSTGSPALPDPAVNSYLMIAYVRLTATPTADWGLLSCTDSALYAAIKTSTLRPVTGKSGGEAATGSVPLPVGSVFPIIIKHDVGRACCKIYTIGDVLDQGYTASSANTGETDYGVAIASSLPAASAGYLYGSTFIGTSAEISDANIAAILTALGWTVSWATTTAAAIKDATSGKYCPASAAQWEAIGIAPPSNQWNLQETAGLFYADVVNDVMEQANGANSGAIVPNTAISGWSRHGAGFVDGTITQFLSTATGTKMPNPQTQSVMVLTYSNCISAAGGSSGTLWSWLYDINCAQNCAVFMTTAGLLGIYNNALGTPGAVDHRGAVHPIVLKYDHTNSLTKLYTDKEVIAGPSFQVATSNVGLNLGTIGTTVPVAGVTHALAAMWAGKVAEPSDAQARAFLQKLGWTVAW